MDFAKRRGPCMQLANTREYESAKPIVCNSNIVSSRKAGKSQATAFFYTSCTITMADTAHEKLRGEPFPA